MRALQYIVLLAPELHVMMMMMMTACDQRCALAHDCCITTNTHVCILDAPCLSSCTPLVCNRQHVSVLVLPRSKVASLQSYVVVSMVQLLCRTIKLGWFDSDANKNIADDCKALLEGSPSAHYHLGLKILNTLVAEMNQPGSSRTLTQVSGQHQH